MPFMRDMTGVAGLVIRSHLVMGAGETLETDDGVRGRARGEEEEC